MRHAVCLHAAQVDLRDQIKPKMDAWSKGKQVSRPTPCCMQTLEN